MIKILQIAPDIDGGGVGGVVYNYMSYMNRNGLRIDILTSDHGYKQFLEGSFERCGINVYTITPRRDNIKKHFQEVNQVIKQGHYDVVHCHEQNWSVFYLIIARKNGTRVRIAHSHLTKQNNDKWKIRILNLFNPLLKRIATGYFACGREAGAYMWGKRIAYSNQLYVMNNAIDVEKFAYQEKKREEYRRKLGIENKYVIGNVGRFSEQKNHEFLIKVFREYKKRNSMAVLLLIGKGELERKIHSLVKEWGLEGAVIFMGQRSDIPELLNTFDIFILPSLYEGLPVVGIEAQANGLPCIYADTITKEAVLLSSTVRISLNLPVEAWADAIDAMKPISRKSGMDIVSDRGFNIINESEKLKQYYIRKSEL